MPGTRAGSSWFHPRGGSTTTGLRSTGAVKCVTLARKLIQPVSDYCLNPNIYRRIPWDSSSLKFGAVLMSPCVSPHPLDDDLRGRCACLKFPLTFSSAQQHRSIVWSAAATGAPRLLPLPHLTSLFSLEIQVLWLPSSRYSLISFLINQDRGRCPSLCHPGLYYGGFSISQSLLASHPLSGAFGDHQCCHRPRGTGNVIVFVLLASVVFRSIMTSSRL